MTIDLSEYNSMGIKHCCTYLSHIPGDQHQLVCKERDTYREALEKIIGQRRDGTYLPSVPHDLEDAKSYARMALGNYPDAIIPDEVRK